MAAYKDVLWFSAVVLGWLSIIPHGIAWYARRSFRAFLKAPLTDEAETMTHFWERHARRWNIVGLSMSGLSILSLVLWLLG